MVQRKLNLIPVADWKPGSKRQVKLAILANARYVLVRPYEFELPTWVKEELTAKGYSAKQIGYTTYKSSTWAVFKK